MFYRFSCLFPSHDRYDFTLKFDDYESAITVFTGADDDIVRMIEMDASFYQRGNIDRAPVSKPEGSHE